MNILIMTQEHENYGAHTWDGKGQCPQYWKAKGGTEFLVRGYTFVDAQALCDDVDALTPQICQSDDYFSSDIISFEVLSDAELEQLGKTEFPFWDEYPPSEISLPVAAQTR